MEDNRDSSNFRQIKSGIGVDSEPRLSVVEGVITGLTSEPGITGSFFSFNTLEIELKSQVYSDHDVLEDLGMDSSEFRVLGLPRTDKLSHVEIGDRLLALFPGKFSEIYCSVIDATTDVQGMGHFGGVGLFRVEAVFECLQHNVLI